MLRLLACLFFAFLHFFAVILVDVLKTANGLKLRSEFVNVFGVVVAQAKHQAGERTPTDVVGVKIDCLTWRHRGPSAATRDKKLEYMTFLKKSGHHAGGDSHASIVQMKDCVLIACRLRQW